MKQISKKQFTNSAFWKIAESFSSKGITMVVSIILARLLTPQDYGVIALTTIFLNLSDILIDGGFSTTLIRKKEVDDCDYSCALAVSLSVATVLYVIYFFISPFVANYYEEPLLSPVLRVLGLIVFVQAFNATRTAIVNRGMQFKFLCYCNILASIISGIAGIIAAYAGLGVWAIVIQYLLQNTLLTCLLFVKVKFKINWCVKVERLKEIIKFSIGVVSASLLYFVTNNIYGAVIGKRYSVTELGYYSKGNQLPEQLSLYTFSAVSGVLLPTISSYQDDLKRVKHIVRKITAFSAYAMFPMMVGMMLTSEELIVLLLTEKWKAASPIMIGACIYYIGMPFTLLNSQIYYALGHSYMKLKIEIVRFVLMALGLLIGSFIFNCSISQLAMISGVIMLVAAALSTFEAGKMLHYSYQEIFLDIIKPIVCTGAMAVAVWTVGIVLKHYGVNSIIVCLLSKVLVGVVIYLILSVITKPDGYYEVKNALLKVISNKGEKR